MRNYNLYALWLLLVFVSCKETNENKIARTLKEWENKEVFFPPDMVFSVLGKDTIDYQPPHTDYKMVFYIDSTGCTSCKLRPDKWKDMINYFNSTSSGKFSYYFIFHPANVREMKYILARDNFDVPVVLDLHDEFNKLNRFPSEAIFHTFLLDQDNRVVLMGNPVDNLAMQKLYLQTVSGNLSLNEKKDINSTTVMLQSSTVDMGEFDWQKSQDISFTLQNEGDQKLVISNIATTCGCISVDYSREPVNPGEELSITITYKADRSEYIDKSILVYCNIVDSPLQLRIKGHAK